MALTPLRWLTLAIVACTLLYLAITQYLGFPNYGDEFKVMGLAPYGEPRYAREIESLVQLRNDGGFELDLSYFRHWSDGVQMTWEVSIEREGASKPVCVAESIARRYP